MQSSNPVFARSEGFNGRAPRQSQYGYPTYPGAGPNAGYGQSGYTDPSTWQTGTPGGPAVDQGRMTIDSVVMRTAMTLAVLVASATATWVLLPPPPAGQQAAMTAWMVGAFGGLGLALFISFKKVVSPALVLLYAAVEGLFVGAASMYFEAMWPGIVMSAVIGTLVAFAGTLAAYKFFNITVTPKFRKIVTIAMFSFVGLVLLDFVLSLVGLNFGFNDLTGLGFIATCIGLVLGVLMLVLDFDFVERGVAAGLPERESWRAAFGLTVTLIWLYIEMLRLLAALRGE
ncbi:MAG TPA: Bax inhibitor-1/YccA family protein [Nocardioidaceae bacterium]|nr:Bax inhibitor-1/YccA family protein [Nocardioidaceae bacterium]